MTCWRIIIQFFLLVYSCATPGYVIINDGDVECASGYYKPSYNSTAICIPCPQGETYSSDSIPDYCKKYLLGVYHNKKRLVDWGGSNIFDDPDSGDDVGGDVGNNNGGNNDPNNDNDKCPEGSTHNKDQIDCVKCPAGRYSDENQASCTLCEEGSVSEEGSPNCVDCGAGMTSDEERIKCVKCPPGTYKDESMTGPCVKCDEGYYSKEGASSCTKCPPKTYDDEGEGPEYNSCNNGNYYDNTIMKCSPCHSFCATCFGPSYKECYKCNYESVYPFVDICGLCLPSCYIIDGYYFDGIACERNLYLN